MPREAIDYSKMVIYKIVCEDEIYVGSTCNFKSRKANHKKACNDENDKKHNFKVYKIIRANGGWKNAVITPIELFPCNSSIEARIREEYWRKELQAEMNTIKAFVTEEEIAESNKKYREEHRVEINERMKKYREEHREEINERKKKPFTCECGAICRICVKSKHFKTKKHQTFICKSIENK